MVVNFINLRKGNKMKKETVEDLCQNIYNDYYFKNWLELNNDEALIAFSLRFLKDNLNEETAEDIYDCLT